MKLHSKLSSRILIAVVLVVCAFQAFQYFTIGNTFSEYIEDNKKDLMAREEAAARNFFQAVEGAIIGWMERGEMDEFAHVLSEQQNAQGVEEFSLFNAKGVVKFSSHKKFLDREMPQELRQLLLSDPQGFIAATNKFKFSGDGLEIYRPVILKDECLACHSDKKVGDINGVDYFRFSLDSLNKAVAHAQEAFETVSGTVLRSGILSVVGLSVILVLMVFYMVRSLVGRPLGQFVDMLRKFEENEGDLTQRVDINSNDEIGVLASLFNSFISKLEDTIRNVSRGTDSLLSSASVLEDTSNELSSSANQASSKAGEVSTASEQVSGSMHSAAVAVEEMSASIQEIAHRSLDAAREAKNATTRIQQSKDSMAELGTSSNEIGEIVEVISSIAEQTNLLALNATIEAARAGEAGKGFSVVANEVKALASETAQATSSISGKIHAMQNSTKGAIESIDELAELVAKMSDYSNAIAGAVEEQTATTNEITKSVSEASSGANSIAQNIAEVAKVAEQTSSGAGKTNTAANELAGLSESLHSLVGQFKFKAQGSEKASSDTPRRNGR